MSIPPTGYIVDPINPKCWRLAMKRQGLPVYTLSQTQVDSLVGANVTNAGTYAIEIWTDSSGVENKKLVSAVQDENNDWHREEDANGVIVEFDLIPAYDSFDEVNPYISSQNLHPREDTDSGSGSDSGTDSGSDLKLSVFDLNSTHLFALTGSESAFEGNYSIVEEDDGQGGTYLTAMPMVLVNGVWDEDPDGIPYPLNSQDFPVMQDVDSYFQAQNLHPVNQNAGDGGDGPQGLPVLDLSQNQVDSLVGANVTNAGTYAIEIWTDSSGVENKKLVSAEQIDNEWHREEDANGVIVEFDLVPAYDSFDEVETFLSTEGFMEPFTEEGTAEVTFVFVDGQPTGFIVDSEDTDSGSGSETTLSSNGTPVQWARTNGDSVSGVIYDLAQPIKVIAPTGYTVVLKNVGENEEYDTELTVVDDVHAVLNKLMGKDTNGFYKLDTDWELDDDFHMQRHRLPMATQDIRFNTISFYKSFCIMVLNHPLRSHY